VWRSPCLGCRSRRQPLFVNARAIVSGHGAECDANTFKGRARAALPALIDGEASAVWAIGGRVQSAFVFTIEGAKITAIDIVMDTTHLAELDMRIG